MNCLRFLSALLLCVFLLSAIPAKAATITDGLSPDEVARVMQQHYDDIREWYLDEEQKKAWPPSKEDLESGKQTPHDPQLVSTLKEILLRQMKFMEKFCKLFPAACSRYGGFKF